MLRNKEAEFLESPLKNYGMFANHGIDIIAFILFVDLVFLYIFIQIIRLCCFRKKNVDKSKLDKKNK